MRHTPVIRMHTVRLGLALGIVSSLAALGLSASTAWADGCTAPGGGPSGSDAPAFTYQCDGTYAGKWTSTYYVYDPSANTESPLYSVDYTYNCTNNAWLQNEWDYDTGSSSYIQNWVPAANTPDQPKNCPAPPATDSTTTGVAMDNTTTSTAQSGDAAVTDNGHAGSATSGNGSTTVTQANLVDSVGDTLGSATIFNTDINGTNCGGAPTCDFTFDPASILPAGASSNGTQPDAALCSTTDVSLSNTITATAASGNATVSGNGDAGDATTGNAQVVVNLINVINSAVAAGQSFIGTINIYGDFNGNIYIPADVVDQLLGSNASGTDPNSTVSNNESIINNIGATALSGSATVAGNGHAGSATTGSTNTHINILNLTGSSIIGRNVLLVFINVLGNWLGMLVNAPAGATSAEFGGDVSSATPSSGTSVVDANANLSITNNVDATATTGDALVASNGHAGNATSGDADIAVNILNIEDSVLSLAHWFGILFINVFGTWNGNFAIMPPTAPVVAPTSDPTPTADGIATTAYGTMHDHTAIHFTTFVSGSSDTSGASDAVLGSAVFNSTPKTLNKSLPAAEHPRANYAIPAIGLTLTVLLLAAAERERLGRLISHK